MYIVNVDEMEIDHSKLYKANGVVSNYLINTANISPFGTANDGNYYFVSNDKLLNAYNRMPFWFKVGSRKPVVIQRRED